MVFAAEQAKYLRPFILLELFHVLLDIRMPKPTLDRSRVMVLDGWVDGAEGARIEALTLIDSVWPVDRYTERAMAD